jgi:hypothetical protein
MNQKSPQPTVKLNGTTVSFKRTVNFIEGTDINLTVTETDSQVNVTVQSTAAGGSGSSTIPFLATGTCPEYLPVTSTGVSANSSTIAHRGKVIGINNATVTSGFMGEAVGYGTITNSGWSWTIGDKIFLNGTALSTTAPSSGFIQFIGTAVASDTIDVQLGEPILL